MEFDSRVEDPAGTEGPIAGKVTGGRSTSPSPFSSRGGQGNATYVLSVPDGTRVQFKLPIRPTSP